MDSSPEKALGLSLPLQPKPPATRKPAVPMTRAEMEGYAASKRGGRRFGFARAVA